MDERCKILIVDDNSENIRVLIEILKREYRLNATTDGIKALEIAQKWSPDIILLDVVMPVINGYDICLRLKANNKTKAIPVVFISAIATPQEELSCIKVGAIDYVSKPINPELLREKIKHFSKIKKDRSLLSQLVESKKATEGKTMNSLFYAAMGVAEFRSKSIGKWHIKRCVEYVKIMISALLTSSRYSMLASVNYAEAIINAVPYHDIGKFLLPDEIILKPAKLTPEQFEFMKTHTLNACELMQAVLLEDDEELGKKTALDIARYHHERWDGTGYPEGLSGESIPICAHIMALVDQYDSIISERIYRSPSYHFEAVRIISAESGKGFDPELVYEFLKVQEQFLEIARKYEDVEEITVY